MFQDLFTGINIVEIIAAVAALYACATSHRAMNMVESLRKHTDKRFEKVDDRLNKIDERLDKMEERLEKADGLFATLIAQVTELARRIGLVDSRLSKLESHFFSAVMKTLLNNADNAAPSLAEPQEPYGESQSPAKSAQQQSDTEESKDSNPSA